MNSDSLSTSGRWDWWPRMGSNHRRSRLQRDALPLSYLAKIMHIDRIWTCTSVSYLPAGLSMGFNHKGHCLFLPDTAAAMRLPIPPRLHFKLVLLLRFEPRSWWLKVNYNTRLYYNSIWSWWHQWELHPYAIFQQTILSRSSLLIPSWCHYLVVDSGLAPERDNTAQRIFLLL